MSLADAMAPALRDAVLGDARGPEAAARAGFYLAVIGTAPDRAGPEDLALAGLVMRAWGRMPAEAVARRLPSLRVEAASRVRAAGAAGRGLRVGSGEVETGRVEPSHAGFFGLDVHRLRHRRFDGGMSPWLLREVFVVGDAVTVLPYDPARDRVLVVEQFRAGPYARGDANPWQIEAIAGRIDPGEAPEDAARREAVEEAGLALGALLPVAGYYPSPGICAEFLYSYVAVCDLPDGLEGVFGVAGEAEDIRTHLMPFDDLMALVASGEAGNAPLILSALWLQRERGRLRG